MKRLYIAGNLIEANLLLGMLHEAGIPARVMNENAQGGLGELPFTQTWPELWIERDNDWERARQIVKQFEHDQGQADQQTICSKCGESNPANFETCWQCQEILKTD